MTQGRSIGLFLVDGTPSGLLTAEIMHWTGHVLTGPCSRRFASGHAVICRYCCLCRYVSLLRFVLPKAGRPGSGHGTGH
ncbi:MAG: hypothetical protein ACJAS0_002502 [Alcanivorax borkumensis]|jgi:hypothetical protein